MSFLLHTMFIQFMKSQTSRNLSMNNDTLIDQTAAILRSGKTILYPTDTIWGLGCDATNSYAVDRIYEIKQRSKDLPFVLLVDSIEMLKKYIKNLHPRVETLLVHHKRPLTLIYNNPVNLPAFVLAKDESVGIRIVMDDFCKSVIKKIGRPIVSTSANISTQAAPKFFREISQEIINAVDYTVPYRQHEDKHANASIIATFNSEGELIIIRG